MDILWLAVVVLIILWVLGLVTHLGGDLIHILLIIVVILVIYNLVARRRRGP